jgi:hypothetical protein
MAQRSFEENLIQSYPMLFPPTERREIPLISCGEGWSMLIELLCEQIQDLVDDKNLPQPKINYIKEKFGLMRVGYENGEGAVEDLVAAAERASGSACEVCGGLGVTQRTKHGWIKTLCPRCATAACTDT